MEKVENTNEENTQKISQATLKKIFKNIVIAVIFMLYFFILNIAFKEMKIERLQNDIEVFSGIIMFVALIIMERAYNQDNDEKAISAIEFIFLSFHSLSIMHITKKYSFDFSLYIGASSFLVAIYYVLKSIIIYTKEQRLNLANMSDVKEIVKKDEPIVKEATKKKKEETQKEQKTEKQANEKEEKQKSEKEEKEND